MSRPLPSRLRWRLRLSALALFWERLWPRLWPAVAVVGTFIAIALFDVLPRLSASAHLIVLVGFIGAFVYALLHAAPALRPVGPAAVRRRLDASAGGERPLTALGDRLAAGEDDAIAAEMWHRHQERMAAAAETLPVHWPAPDLPRHEPWGIRAGVLLLLVIAVAAGGEGWQDRLVRAVQPQLDRAGAAAGVEVWITPPAYTAQPPLFLRGDQGSGSPDAPALHIPAGSTVLARVTGVTSIPRLHVGDAEAAFTALPSDQGAPPAYRAETTVTSGDRIGVRTGRRELAGWPILLVPDRPPTVAAPTVADAKGNGLLDIGFDASDDYGVAELVARITPEGAPAGLESEELRRPLTLGEPGAPAVAGRALLDLASHPWAGRQAVLALEGRDLIGQTGLGPAVGIVIPERSFSHPVARAIVAERKRLLQPAWETRSSVAAALASIAADPARFDEDVVVSLGLSVARWRLLGNDGDDPTTVRSVYDLLWELALRLEDGGIPAAERRLAEARQQLADALRTGASEPEIERLMDALRDALDEYLAALATELSRRPEAEMTPMPLGRTLRADALRNLIDRARELSRAGARDEARALLSDLQRVLDGLRLGLREGAAAENLRQAERLMQDLRALEARQRALLDGTFQRLREQEQRRGNRRGANGDAQSGAAAQRDLRRDLGDLAERLQDQLGGIPGPLGTADQAMRDALRALGGERLADAVGAQGRAADALGQALAQAREAIARQLGEGFGRFGFGRGGEGDGDPFGRPAGGSYGFADGTVEIPERTEIERIQELLRELRRRAGERDRPSDELDYIHRLLKPF